MDYIAAIYNSRWARQNLTRQIDLKGGRMSESGLIITGFETHLVGNPWKNWLFLTLNTSDGLQGIGEASLNGFTLTTAAAIQELQGYFVGRSAFDIRAIRRDMLQAVYSDGGQIHRSATTAVEAACWDLVGKALGKPVYVLWGGKVRDQIRLYANGWYRTERDPAAFAESAQAAINLGYTALKFDPFGATRGGFAPGERTLALAIILGVRDAVPPGTDLFIEGHCRFDVPTAIALAYSLADFDIGWFEEPVSHWNKPGLAEVARRSPVRIATGENFTRCHEFIELAHQTKNLVLQPDVMNLGGLAEARQVCELGEALELPVAPHDAQGPISKALCMQLAAGSTSIIIQEDFELFNDPWTHSLASPLDRRDGYASILEMPGLGRSLNFDVIAQHPYDANATLPLYEKGWELRGSAAETHT